MQTEPQAVVSIFLSSAPHDQQLLNELKAHLAPLRRQGLITLWADTDSNARTAGEHEIDQHLNTAQIILLLVSPDYMNSDYCYGVEMKRAIERHERGEARVIPIILRPVYWERTVLGNLRVLPQGGKPVTTWSDREEV